MLSSWISKIKSITVALAAGLTIGATPQLSLAQDSIEVVVSSQAANGDGSITASCPSQKIVRGFGYDKVQIATRLYVDKKDNYVTVKYYYASRDTIKSIALCANSSLTGEQRTVQETGYRVPPNGYTDFQSAFCNSGERLIGGAASSWGVSIMGQYPIKSDSGREGWRIHYANDSISMGTPYITSIAYCLSSITDPQVNLTDDVSWLPSVLDVMLNN